MTSVDTSVAVIVFNGTSANAPEGTDRAKGDGGGSKGEGLRGMGTGELDSLELDEGDNRGNVDLSEEEEANESNVVWLGLRRVPSKKREVVGVGASSSE